ncbi:MAG: alpha/beta fold hydrolase [Actinomycetota bacterium]|nr:alpha/beta fold hydrolase [Actinomycetota bacterium]
MTTTTERATATLTTEDGLMLGYRELGSGPAVLLLHGWPTSSHLWRNVMPTIGEHNRVLALDLPGFGASDKPSDVRYSFDFFERAIDGFLAALGIDEEVGVAGHDLGGPIAVHWALERRSRVSHLALLNTLLYPEFSDAVRDFVSALSSPVTRDELVSRAGLEDVMRLGVAHASALDDRVVAAVTAPFTTDDDRLALAAAGIGLSVRGFAEIAAGLPTLTMPVRVVYGTDDRILPDVADTMVRLQRDVPHAVITTVLGAGHFVQEDAPAQVADVLAEFFAS